MLCKGCSAQDSFAMDHFIIGALYLEPLCNVAASFQSLPSLLTQVILDQHI
jgi:hypothetical protein